MNTRQTQVDPILPSGHQVIRILRKILGTKMQGRKWLAQLGTTQHIFLLRQWDLCPHVLPRLVETTPHIFLLKPLDLFLSILPSRMEKTQHTSLLKHWDLRPPVVLIRNRTKHRLMLVEVILLILIVVIQPLQYQSQILIGFSKMTNVSFEHILGAEFVGMKQTY